MQTVQDSLPPLGCVGAGFQSWLEAKRHIHRNRRTACVVGLEDHAGITSITTALHRFCTDCSTDSFSAMILTDKHVVQKAIGRKAFRKAHRCTGDELTAVRHQNGAIGNDGREYFPPENTAVCVSEVSARVEKLNPSRGPRSATVNQVITVWQGRLASGARRPETSEHPELSRAGVVSS